MPSRRTKSVAINERISEAQKRRTRLACIVCRSRYVPLNAFVFIHTGDLTFNSHYRRIKCDGQKGACGRCRQDKRSDCSYEIVGSAERMAGRQRKRLLRKQHVSDDDDASVSTEREGGNQSETEKQQDWTSSPLLTSTRSPIFTSPQQTAQSQHLLIQNNHPAAVSNTQRASSSSANIRDPSTDSFRKTRINLTPVSSLSSSTNTTSRNNDDSTRRYDSSFLTSTMPSSADSSTTPNGAMASGLSNPNSSWGVMSSPHISIDQNSLPPMPNLTQPSFDDQTISEIDPGSTDSLWRVYDWQYRCNSGMPPQYLSQAATGGPAFTP